MLENLLSNAKGLGKKIVLPAMVVAAGMGAGKAEAQRIVHFDADPSAAIPGYVVDLTEWEVSLYRVDSDSTKIAYDLRNVVNSQEGMVVQGFILNVPQTGEVIKDGIMAPANIRTLPGEDLGNTGSHAETPGTETSGIDDIYELRSATGSGNPFFAIHQDGIKKIAFDNDGFFVPLQREWNRQSVEKYNRLFSLVEFVEYNSSQGDPLGWEPGKTAVYRAIWQDGGNFRAQTDIPTATTLYNANTAGQASIDEDTFEAMTNTNASPHAGEFINSVADSYLRMLAVDNLSDVKDENENKGGYFQIGNLGIESVPQLHGPNAPKPTGEILQDSRLDANGSADLYISEPLVANESSSFGSVKAMFR